MHTNLLLSDVIDEIEKDGGAFAHHEPHINDKLAEKPTTEVLLSHTNDSLDFLGGKRGHTYILQVNDHDPVFDYAWYEQLLDNELTEKGSGGVQNIYFWLDFDHLSHVQNDDWPILIVSPSDVQEATFKNFSDLLERDREGLAQPSTMLNYVL